MSYTPDSTGNFEDPPAANCGVCPGYQATGYYHEPYPLRPVRLAYMPGLPATSYSIAFVTSDQGAEVFRAGRYHGGSFSCAEFNGAPTFRTAAIAADPCTFESPWSGVSTVWGGPYWVAGPVPPPADFSGPVLQPNSVYYFNITAIIDGLDYCAAQPSQTCGWFCDWLPG